MSKEYGLTKRFEDLENRPQSSKNLENYLINTSFKLSNYENKYLVGDGTENNSIAFHRGTYDWNWEHNAAMLPPNTYISTFSVKENIAMNNTKNFSFSKQIYANGFSMKWSLTGAYSEIRPESWGGVPTLYSLKYQGAGVHVSIILIDFEGEDVEIAQGHSEYSEHPKVFNLMVPKIELIGDQQLLITISNLTESDTTILHDCQLEAFNGVAERTLYTEGKYTDLDAILSSAEMYWVSDRLGGVEKYSYVDVTNLVPNSSFLNLNGNRPAYWNHTPELTEETYQQILSGSKSSTERLPYHNPALGYTVLDAGSSLYMTSDDGKGGMQLIPKINQYPSRIGSEYHTLSFRLSTQEAKNEVGNLVIHLYPMEDRPPDLEDDYSVLFNLEIPHNLSELEHQVSTETFSKPGDNARYSVVYNLIGDWIQVNVATKLELYFNRYYNYTYQPLLGIAFNNLSDMPYLITDVQVTPMVSDLYAMPHRYKLGPLSLPGHYSTELEPDPRIGNLDILNTVNKTTLVDAVNEVLEDRRGGIQFESDPKVGNLDNLSTSNKSDVVSALNEVFNDVDEGKRSIASALTDKQQPATGDETFRELSNKIRDIETGGGVTPPVELIGDSLLLEKESPKVSIEGIAEGKGDTTWGDPIVVLTDNIDSYEVASLTRDLTWEMSSNYYLLRKVQKRRKVILYSLSNLSLLETIVPKFKVVLALTGKLLGEGHDSYAHSYIARLTQTKIPVFDMASSSQLGSIRSLLLGESTSLSLAKDGATVGKVYITPESTLFPRLAGNHISLPIYPFSSQGASFPMMVSTDFSETYIVREVGGNNLSPTSLLIAGDVGNPWSHSTYPKPAQTDWIESTEANNRYITNKDIGDSQSSQAVLSFPTSANTNLLFEYKTDSESAYDKLLVYVNEVLVLTASGSHNWKEHQHKIVSDGVCTVKFVYSKDSSVSTGTDSAYVRNIRFSVNQGTVSGTGSSEKYSIAYKKALGNSSLTVYAGYCSSNGGTDISGYSQPMGKYRDDVDSISNTFFRYLLIFGDEETI